MCTNGILYGDIWYFVFPILSIEYNNTLSKKIHVDGWCWKIERDIIIRVLQCQMK